MAARKKPAEKPKPEITSNTHGFNVVLPTDRASDGVERSVAVNLLTNGRYHIRIATHWPQEARPTTTNIVLSRDGMTLLGEALFMAAHEMHCWPVKTPLTAKG